MNRACRLLVSLSLMTLVLAGVSWGQPDPRPGHGRRPERFYNPQTVVTVSGIVVSMTPPAQEAGLPYLVYLTLQTKDGKISVFLGPNIYVNKLAVKIKVLDKIQVTGSRIIQEGKPIIMAAEIKKGDRVLKFRHPNGVPYWRGRG